LLLNLSKVISLMEKSASVFWLQKGNTDTALQINLIARWQPPATGNSPATIWVARCVMNFPPFLFPIIQRRDFHQGALRIGSMHRLAIVPQSLLRESFRVTTVLNPSRTRCIHQSASNMRSSNRNHSWFSPKKAPFAASNRIRTNQISHCESWA